MALSPQWLDELRSRITLSSLIGRTVRVQKAGREFKACCPFHDEKSPSFTINDAKGFYHCFGCGAHGDAIRWMTDNRGLQFMDAVKELALEANMEVPAPDPRAQEQAKQRNSLYDVMEAAQEFFEDQLGSIEGAEAREYLKKRGFPDAICREFGFGFAPDSKGGLKRALASFGDEMLVEAGLLISVEGKSPYDRFRGRLMLPIRDARGRVIAFGGRILGAGEPKYLNSPDTPLFDKGRTLYNLDKALPATRESGQLLVVEGYMDAIALAAAGFRHVVAPLGTALTEQQIEIMWRSAERPILCLDGDNAGQRAAMRAAARALPLLRPGHSLDFATLPEGQDPDDYLKAHGAAAFRKLLDVKKPLVSQLWAQELAAEPLDTPEERAGLRARLKLHLERIEDREVRRHYADAFDERLTALFARPQKSFLSFKPSFGPRGRNGFKPLPNKRPLQDTSSLGQSGMDLSLTRAVIAGLLRHPCRIEPHFDALISFAPQDPLLDRLLQQLIQNGMGKEKLDETALDNLMGDNQLYNSACELLRADKLRFTFTLPPRTMAGTDSAQHDPAHDMAYETAERQAKSDLDEAIRVMVMRPAIARALSAATRIAEADMTEENYAEQQRLRQEMENFDNRLADLMQRDDDL